MNGALVAELHSLGGMNLIPDDQRRLGRDHRTVGKDRVFNVLMYLACYADARNVTAHGYERIGRSLGIDPGRVREPIDVLVNTRLIVKVGKRQRANAYFLDVDRWAEIAGVTVGEPVGKPVGVVVGKPVGKPVGMPTTKCSEVKRSEPAAPEADGTPADFMEGYLSAYMGGNPTAYMAAHPPGDLAAQQPNTSGCGKCRDGWLEIGDDRRPARCPDCHPTRKPERAPFGHTTGLSALSAADLFGAV